LRDAAEAAPGGRPEILLLALGRPADFTARVTFARSFFESGGFATKVSDAAATPEEALKAASGAKAVALCTSDAVLGEMAGPILDGLAKSGVKARYAAAPPANDGPLAADADLVFVHRRADALAVLRDLYATLGLKTDDTHSRSHTAPA
jgi:methylmalonyl-CoA mutase